MGFTLIQTFALAVASLAAALPAASTPHGHSGNRSTHDGQCKPFTIPVPVKATAFDFGIPPITNKYEVTQWAVSATAWSSPTLPNIIQGNVSVDETFHIYGQLCVPHHGAKKNILHLATHGIAFDHAYWDVETDPAQYSYVYNALEAGYSILTYDRITVGKSSKPNGYVVAQGNPQVEVLRGITEMVRSGELFDYVHGLERTPKFESIVHVGHSFGSFVTDALITLYGNLSDGAILTGFIPTSHTTTPFTGLGFDFARTNDPKFADRPDAYIVSARDIDVQTGFFSALANRTLNIGGFDPALLELANSTKQPGTVAELISLPLLAAFGPATAFKGPVQFMEAEYDFLICGGDCHDWNQTAIDETYVNAKDVEVYLQPGTGHGMTMHRNASIGYKRTFDFLDRNGL